LILYNLILVNHVYLGRGYDRNINLCLDFLAKKINEQSINSVDVIAVGERSSHPILGYLTGKTVVYFSPDTIKRLIGENRLQDAFNQYNIKYVAGFDSMTSGLIKEKSSVKNIADWPDPELISSPVGFTKMWFLNLVR
jgi:hypothetical protein